jgi:hypothetical protein
MFAQTSFTKVDQDLVKITDGLYRIMELHAAASIPLPILIAFPLIYVTNSDALAVEYAPCKSIGMPRHWKGVKGAGLGLRRSFTLDALEVTHAIAAGQGVAHLARLPHGECGVWGRAPRCSNSHHIFLPPIIYRDHHPINSSDRTHN